MQQVGWLWIGMKAAAVALIAGLVVATAAAPGQAAAHDPFVAASPALLAKCAATARAVGYPVPCPTRIPRGLAPSGGRPGCELDVIGPARRCPNTAPLWRGWVVGSSATADEHLVLTASPHPLHDYARAVNGPAWHAGDHVLVLGSVRVNNWSLTEVFVPAASNDGSAFAGHLVLVWTTGGHTYALGFHEHAGRGRTLALDLALVRGIRLV